MERISHFIDGKFWTQPAAQTGPVFNPATGEEVARVDFATVEVVDAAVAAAKTAAKEWRTTSLAKRTQVLFAFREGFAQLAIRRILVDLFDQGAF